MSDATPIRHIAGEPAHLRDNDGRRFKLLRWANMLAGYYGAPVYLVGSALIDHNAEPRDWDVRVQLSVEDFGRLFGDVAAWVNEGVTGNWTAVRWRWSEECVKRAKEGWEHTHLNIDFQLQPPGEWNRYDRPRLRLDTKPEGSK